MKTLVVANQKGGVGKTTLTVHLGYMAQQMGLRVLLVDMDTQGSLGLSFPKQPGAVAGTLNASDLYSPSIDGLKPEVINDKTSIIRRDKKLAVLDMQPGLDVMSLRASLASLAADYDICVMDTPPGKSLRLVAALASADFVVTPVSIGLYELEGVGELIETVMSVRKEYNPKMNYLGIAAMKTNMRRVKEAQQFADLKKQAGKAMLDVHFPERAAVRNAVEARKPVWVDVRGESHGKASTEWKTGTKKILSLVMKKP